MRLEGSERVDAVEGCIVRGDLFVEVQRGHGGGCLRGSFRLQDCDRGIVAGGFDGQGHEPASRRAGQQHRAEDAMEPGCSWAHAHRAVDGGRRAAGVREQRSLSVVSFVQRCSRWLPKKRLQWTLIAPVQQAVGQAVGGR